MINQAGLDLIKEFEGLRSRAYKDPVGIWTIGYGTTAAAGVGISPSAGMIITDEQAEMYLQRAVDKFAAQIIPKLTRQATPNQFAAMVSLAYNIGPGAFSKSSVLKRFNAGDVLGSADAFLMWNKADGRVLKGLVRRRQSERALFLTVNKQPAPSAPDHDYPPPARLGWWGALIAALIQMFKGGK